MQDQETEGTEEAARGRSEAQKKVVASLLHPRLHFAPKSAAQLAAEQKAAEEENRREQAEALDNAKVGDKLPDGSIYAGISPDTHRPMCAAADDAPFTMTFNRAAEYAEDIAAHGHRDWRVPTKAELHVLFQNRKKGALKGTFNSTGSCWYWTSTEDSNCTGKSQDGHTIHFAWGEKFKEGDQIRNSKHNSNNVRCVRN